MVISTKKNIKGLIGTITILLIIICSSTGSAQEQGSQEDLTQQDLLLLDIREPILTPPTWFNVTNINTMVTKLFPVPVTETINPKYTYLDLRVVLLTRSIMLGTLHITLGTQTKTHQFSHQDFDPFGQIILRYDDLELTDQEQLEITFEFDHPTFSVTEFSAALLVSTIDLYFLTPPVNRPIIVPINQTVYNTGFFEEEHQNFDIFLPQEQTFTLTINSSAEIRITYLAIKDVKQYNTPKDQEYNTTHTFIFRTDEKEDYLLPKKVTLRFVPIRKIPIDLIVTGRLEPPESITIILLPLESEILINTSLILLVALPLGKLFRDRRNKTLRKRRKLVRERS